VSRRLQAADRSLLLGSSSLLLSGVSFLLSSGGLLLRGSGLLLSRGRLLLRLGHLGRIRSVDCGPCHDGSAAPDAEDRMRFGHQLHGQKRYIGDEHQDKGNGYYCNLKYRLHLLPPFGVGVWTVNGMKVIAFVPLGGTKVNRASATAGATFQSLMTVVMLSR
jgi:hypothetical protein